MLMPQEPMPMGAIPQQVPPQIPPADDPTVRGGEVKYSAAWFRPRVESMCRLSRAVNAPANRRREQMAGPGYADGYGQDEDHCGFYWKLLSDLKPAMVSGDLAVEVSSRNGKTTQSPDGSVDHAEAAEEWINREITESGLTDTLDTLCDDMAWSAGVALCEVEDDPDGKPSTYHAMLDGSNVPQQRVRVRAISPDRFFIDEGNDVQNARMMGHRETLTYGDVVRGASGKPDAGGWDIQAVLELIRDRSHEARKVRECPLSKVQYETGEFVCFRVWCKETGMIHTLAWSATTSESKGSELKKPEKWTGHERGPYVVFGVAWMRNKPWPLSVTAIAERGAKNQDRTRKKIQHDAENYRRNVVMKGANALRQFMRLDHGDGFNGDAQSVKEVVSGGIQPEALQHIQYTNADLEALFGLSQARQGAPDPKVSATADAIAMSAADVRRKYMAFRFRCCVRELLTRMLYFAVVNPRIETTIPVMDPGTGQLVPKKFWGGVRADDPFEWEDIAANIKIEPYSIGEVDQATRQRSMDAVAAILMEFQQMVLANPLGAMIINWENWLDDRMAAAQAKGGGRRYINYQVVHGLMRAQLLSMMSGGGPLGQAPGIGAPPNPPSAPSTGRPRPPGRESTRPGVGSDEVRPGRGSGNAASANAKQAAGVRG